MAKHLAQKDKNEEDKVATNTKRKRAQVIKEIKVKEKAKNTSPKHKVGEHLNNQEKAEVVNINRKLLAVVQKIRSLQVNNHIKNTEMKVDKSLKIIKKVKIKVGTKNKIMEAG